MKIFSRSSRKVSVNGCGRSDCSSVERADNKVEIYKSVSEGTQKEEIQVKHELETKSSSESTMVQEVNNANDGADEQMLRTDDNEKLAEKREEVKFVKGDHQNGDAKVDIGVINGKAFTGMTKEELMKYANDPFWVRLRWIFFIAFWIIWVGMLVGAIMIIIDAPKCAAPEPLSWYKRGLLAKFSFFEAKDSDVDFAKDIQASGVIYELPPELTYRVNDPEVEEKIKDIISIYKDSEINVILDITPNYVPKNSQMVEEAMADETKRQAFIWIEKPEVPNNWLSLVNGSAWAEISPGNYVLSQFGDGLYDLHMNNSLVKEKFSNVLNHLVELGIKGFRLKNTKFYILSKNIQNEVPADETKYDLTQYGFWTHTQTTFQEGLGDVLYEYMSVVKNSSEDAFLSVADDIIRPEIYETSAGEIGVDMPVYGRFVHNVGSPSGKQLGNELLRLRNAVGNYTWLQWDLADINEDSDVDPSAVVYFLSLLPGVPVVPTSSELFNKVNETTYKHIEQLRESPSFMHGDFEMFNSDPLVSYSRLKSGNPGFLVVFNPTDVVQRGNFSVFELPGKMGVDALSDNYNVTDISVRSRVAVDALEVSPLATIILTYVPVRSG